MDDILKALDFEPEGMTCDAGRIVWLEASNPIPSHSVRLAHNSGGCSNLSDKICYLRRCICWNDPRQIAKRGEDFRDFEYVGGLIVIKMVLCSDHQAYYRDYLQYPFICPDCGIYFGGPEEIILRTNDIDEDLTT